MRRQLFFSTAISCFVLAIAAYQTLPAAPPETKPASAPALPANQFVETPICKFPSERINSAMAFTIDGRRLICATEKGTLIDGKETTEYRANGAYFTEDGKHFVFDAFTMEPKGISQWLIHDGEKIGPFKMQPKCIRISPDGKRIAYVRLEARGMFAVIDGKDGPPFRNIPEVVFSQDSKHVAYMIETENRMQAVVYDGKLGTEFFQVTGLRPMPSDAALFDYNAKLKLEEGKAKAIVSHVVHGPNGADVRNDALVKNDPPAWEANASKRPRKIATQFDQLTSLVAVSKDGKHEAYATMTSPQHNFVVDGKASRDYELIRCRLPRFDDDNTVEFLAIGGGKLIRVQYRAE